MPTRPGNTLATLLATALTLAAATPQLAPAQDQPTIILADGQTLDPTADLAEQGLTTTPQPPRRDLRKAALPADSLATDSLPTDSLSRHQLRKAQRREERILACIPLVDVTVDSQAIRKGTIYDYYTSQPIGMLGHSPHTATMYAAVLPGLGQIYNHSYWKLAILYGGAGALGYAIHFNNKYYKQYTTAYRDFLLRDPNNRSYMHFARQAHLTEEQVETTYASWFEKALKSKKDYYRRYRDLSIFGMVGLYLLQIVDACVDAHFWNFDISDDLSLRVAPVATPEEDGQVGASVTLDIGGGDRHKTRRHER